MLSLQMLLFGWVVITMKALSIVPMTLLCLNQTLRQGIKSGMAFAIGATLSQILYALIGVFRLIHIPLPSLRAQMIIAGAGTCIFIYLGIREFWLRVENAPVSQKMKFLPVVFIGFLVMWLNIKLNLGARSIFYHSQAMMPISDIILLGIALFLGFITAWIAVVLITGAIKYFLSVKWQNYVRYLGGFCLAVYALLSILMPAHFPLIID